jgi:hypothetical protein
MFEGPPPGGPSSSCDAGYAPSSSRIPSRVWLSEQGASRAQYVSATGTVARFTPDDQNNDLQWSLDHLACNRSDRIVRYY